MVYAICGSWKHVGTLSLGVLFQSLRPINSGFDCSTCLGAAWCFQTTYGLFTPF
jgi:hypothetical protein